MNDGKWTGIIKQLPVRVSEPYSYAKLVKCAGDISHGT